MTPQFLLIDIAPDPVSIGIGVVLAVILFVIVFIAVVIGALVFFLWYRKRSLRGVEMIRSDAWPTEGAPPTQPNNPNQP